MQIILTPQIKAKIAVAKEYSDRVKSISAAYNTELQGIWKRYLSLLKRAAITKSDTTPIVDALIKELRILLVRVLEACISLACEREEVDRDRYATLLPLSVPQCNTDYYELTLSKYDDILRQELAFALENGYTVDEFLEDPRVFMSYKPRGLLLLKESITEVEKGISYSFLENLKKLGISAAALAFLNAEMELWKNNGGIMGYFGVRNSNYPCSLCDTYAYQFIPISQGMIYPLHNRCVCSVIPLRQNELPL